MRQSPPRVKLRRPCSVFVVFSVALAGSYLVTSPFSKHATAQRGLLLEREFRYSGTELPQDRNLTRGIRKAEESLNRGEFTQALRFLDKVLASEKDYFVVQRQAAGQAASEQIIGLKEKARQLLSQLSPEGREAYLAAYAPAARRELVTAIESGDRASLFGVIQRYFHTPVGYEAAMLLAQRDADDGRTNLATITYEHLLRTPAAVEYLGATLPVKAALNYLAAGNEQRAEAVLSPLGRQANLVMELGGETTKLTARRTTVPWVKRNVGLPRDTASQDQTDWQTIRGNPARNANSVGGFPHMRVRWEARLLAHPRLERIYQDFRNEKLHRRGLTPLASTPLAIGDTILIRSAHSLIAVDFETGKRIWQAEPQPVAEIEQLAKEGAAGTEGPLDPESARFFGQRLWQDHLYCSLSSDGRRVFVIRNLKPLEEVDDDPFGRALQARGSAGQAMTNRLCAYDLETQGKLLWEFDGAIPGGALSGGFFLGTPLALGDTLYGMVEIKSSVWLYAVNSDSGKVTWKQQLVNLDRSVQLDSQRRLQNATPSYSDGILICPIGSGMVIGIDLFKQSLGWAYRYEVRDASVQRYSNQNKQSKNRFQGTWTDAATVIAGDRVLLTPPESNRLHCIDLRSGKLLWHQQQQEMMKLACVGTQNLLLLGPKGLRGVRLADGKPAWPEIKFPKDTSPTGSGFLSEGRYYLPLSSAEVVAIDLSLGEIVAHVKARDGKVLGNLICHRNAVFANDGKSLQRFDQIEVLRQDANRLLAASPNHVESLRTLGEIAYNQGRLSDAVSLLERAYQGDEESESTREILSEALLAALAEDYAAYDAKLPFLERLQDGSPKPRAELLRIKAEGLTQTGQYLEAARACISIYKLDLPHFETFDLKQDRVIAIPNWVNAQLNEIHSRSSPEIQKQILEELSKLVSGVSDEDFEIASRVVAYFSSLLDAETKLQLARLAVKDKVSLAAQMKWQELLRSEDPDAQAEATARLASLLHQQGQSALARDLDQRLTEALAEKPVFEGLTGKQISETLSIENLPELSWPVGRVEANSIESTQSRHTSRSPQYGIRMERTDEILGSCRVALSRVGKLTVCDSLGREFFRASVESQQRRRVHYRQASSMHAVSYGSILVVSFGRQLAAFNTIATSANAQPTILWQANLTSELEGNSFAIQPEALSVQRPGSYRSSRSTWDGSWIGVLGPVSSRGCVYQDQRRLVCVDLLDGSLLWSRDDVTRGCDLFGDEEFVFATPQGARQARVFSMIDGRELGQTEVPPWREHLTTLGRKVICWSQDANQPKATRLELAAIDAWTGKTLWSERYPEGTRVDVDRGRYLACVTPEGQSKIIDGETGAAIVSEDLGELRSLKEVHLTVGSESILLVTNSTNNRPGRSHARAINPSDYAIVSGKVAAFDRRTGKPLWARPAELNQQGWPVAQPCDLPALLFVANLYRHDASNGSRQGITMLALDRRTGASVFRSSELPTSSGGHFQARVADPNQNTLQVEMSTKRVQLRFTEKPRPPLPPALSEVESDNLPAKRGISGIIEQLRRGD